MVVASTSADVGVAALQMDTQTFWHSFTGSNLGHVDIPGSVCIKTVVEKPV